MNNTTKSFISLGLLGTVVVGFAPTTRAQVQITGGDFSSTAGFFLPETGTEVKLLDAAIKSLYLESEIGNTSTALFTPTAARFSNDINPDVATVDPGDTGALRGLLTGLAYDSDGYPVIFTNVATQLNFAVESFDFDAADSLVGTLITPEVIGAAPLVFINREVRLTADSDEDFNTIAGQLDVGTLNASLLDDGGTINLPTTFSFGSGSGSTPLPSLERRVKFDFRGKDVLAAAGTDLDIEDDELRFVGDANYKFQVQTVGTRATSEFKIKADDSDDAVVDITLGGPFTKLKGDATDIDLEETLDYEISGEAEGSITALLGTTASIAEFEGTARRDVKFKFDQDDDEFEGRSRGTVNFLAAVGTEGFGDGDDATDGSIGLDNCDVCTVETEDQAQQIAFNIRVTSVRDLLSDEDDLDDSLSDSDDVDDLSEDELEAIAAELEAEDFDLSEIKIEVKVYIVGLDRYFVVYPGKSAGKGRGNAFGRAKVLCFRAVGPGSSIFPGLISLEPVDLEDAPTQIIIGLEELELADADIDDDADDVSDDDSDDDSDDSDDDSDDSDDDADEDSDDSDDDADDDSDDDDADDDSDDDSDDDDADDVSDDDSDDSDDDAASEDVIIVPGLEEFE